jgi:hypothetical protein
MYYEQHKFCPVDKKRCDAEGYLRGTEYSGVSGVCRYGYFDEDEREPRNCDLTNPRKKLHVFTMRPSELMDIREAGFHGVANNRTSFINPKKYPTHLKYLQSLGKYEKNVKYRKKSKTTKPKRKTCSCKK